MMFMELLMTSSKWLNEFKISDQTGNDLKEEEEKRMGNVSREKNRIVVTHFPLSLKDNPFVKMTMFFYPDKNTQWICNGPFHREKIWRNVNVLFTGPFV